MAAPWEQRQAADAPLKVGKLRLPEAVGGVKGEGGRPTAFRRGVSAAENPSKTVRKIDLNEKSGKKPSKTVRKIDFNEKK